MPHVLSLPKVLHGKQSVKSAVSGAFNETHPPRTHEIGISKANIDAYLK